MFALPNALDECRIGLTATRKFGGAVLRNRAKRRLREVFRRLRHRLDPPYDLVINVHRPIMQQSPEELERQFLGCFERLGRAQRGRPNGAEPGRGGKP